MEYTIEDIEKIESFKTWSDRKKVDELLRIDCNMYTNLGSDSTKTEKETINKAIDEYLNKRNTKQQGQEEQEGIV